MTSNLASHQEVVRRLISQTVWRTFAVDQTVSFVTTAITRSVTDALLGLGLADEFHGFADAIRHFSDGWLSCRLLDMQQAALTAERDQSDDTWSRSSL